MKSHFIVHTNGQDEWIKVDKRTYDKAIDMFCDAHEAEIEELRSTINRFVEEAAMYSNALDRNKEAYKAELKNKEEKHGDELQALLNDMGRAISKLSGELKAKDERIEAQSSVIIACQNAILQKDERIEELEAMVEKMKCCENCNFYPSQKCFFNTQYGCLDGLIPSDWKIKGTNNE